MTLILLSFRQDSEVRHDECCRPSEQTKRTVRKQHIGVHQRIYLGIWLLGLVVQWTSGQILVTSGALLEVLPSPTPSFPRETGGLKDGLPFS